MSEHSFSVEASGFSTKTCFPRSRVRRHARSGSVSASRSGPRPRPRERPRRSRVVARRDTPSRTQDDAASHESKAHPRLVARACMGG